MDLKNNFALICPYKYYFSLIIFQNSFQFRHHKNGHRILNDMIMNVRFARLTVIKPNPFGNGQYMQSQKLFWQ